MVETVRTLTNLYRLGWDERNGGNLSYLLYDEDIEGYLDTDKVIRNIPMTFDATAIKGKVFLVTGTGKYFKNVEKDPEHNLGIVRIAKDGTTAELLWGYKDGGKFTSEFPAHMMSHISRLAVDPEHRVVMHSHPTYTIAMNTVCPVDDRDFTHKLWQSNTEAVVVFPDGVGVLPWMVCGGREIAVATSEKMKKYDVTVWAHHGIFVSGTTFDEAFGLCHTIEKSAEIAVKVRSVSHSKLQTITRPMLRELAAAFKIKLAEIFMR